MPPTPPPPCPLEEDPVLAARVERALRPYAGRLTPEALAEARRALALVLSTHPQTAALLDRIRQSGAPGSSGVVARRSAGGDEHDGGEKKVG